MTDNNIDLNKLSEEDLLKLISKSKQQIKKLKKQQKEELNSKDADVVEVADAVRALAKSKKVTPAVALTAIAKNMRVGMVAQRKTRDAVAVKYRHPDDDSKTWKGMGKRPLWLQEELNSGKSLEEFQVN